MLALLGALPIGFGMGLDWVWIGFGFFGTLESLDWVWIGFGIEVGALLTFKI